ncbi:hypothetical protein LTR91_024351 [Friedmanniomyces endolithicus]|uniref:Uncharacterized protein n=1 Tax=Friedmanniomyces endolithicus TaxID=329885 RepID=A0AAN6H188_9PEZI|nr:hypothetical protein LTR94_013343 [Friedmanniomyces endolithicus]KAK0780764.1 hypothetical protein LTR75_014924 [Friedmanniomyces endolithicus]KAK0786754.1 hypothetical protein LTR59_010560 [Friedmanniomyces endolithicus]KAK0803313.1 hypothetical protein LTR38_006173 [Friedmanniomyces endolithicus]KAK0833492.1 hypothetical protein LTR03_014725 [Friedmanniomyces endolithicus]
MLSLASRCGICGEPLLSGDLTSDPSQHFCGLELAGTAIVQPIVVSAEMIDESTSDSRSSSSLSADDDAPTTVAPAVVHELAASTPHNPLDLAEIGRLHMENAALKSIAAPALMMSNMSDASSTPRYAPAIASKPVTREVAMASGEKLMVEVAVHAK